MLTAVSSMPPPERPSSPSGAPLAATEPPRRPAALAAPAPAPGGGAPTSRPSPTRPASHGARLRGTARARAAKLSNKQWGAAATGLALILSAAFGGLDEAAAELVPAVPGEPVAVAPFDVVVTRATHAVTLTDAIPDSSHGRYLLVFAELTNTTDEPVTRAAIAESVRLVDVEGLVGYFDGAPIEDPATAEPQLIHALDSTWLGFIGPGMSYAVAFLWEQDGDADIPPDLEIELVAHTWRRSTLDNSWIWTDPAVVTTMTVPLEAWAPPESDPEAGGKG